ncbi:hypothetical protein PIB30_102134 [Stylosanthes scabra]|uniref:Uncharacterized protein n=1 Tax=Stylosanthes scabra TaxID=79078 RepID=A0ABU6YX17_9FABA|nr:hypothetical protein [Stylosanthes scabra]
MAPRLHGSQNLELAGYHTVSRKVKLSVVLGNVIPWFWRSRFRSDTPQHQLAEKRQTKPTAEASGTDLDGMKTKGKIKCGRRKYWKLANRGSEFLFNNCSKLALFLAPAKVKSDKTGKSRS